MSVFFGDITERQLKEFYEIVVTNERKVGEYVAKINALLANSSERNAEWIAEYRALLEEMKPYSDNIEAAWAKLRTL